jgi:hypothetical protein
MMKARGWSNAKKEPWAKESWQTWETVKSKEADFPEASRKNTDLQTLI